MTAITNERAQLLSKHNRECDAVYNGDLPVVCRFRYYNEFGERIEKRIHRCETCGIEFVWEWVVDEDGAESEPA